MAERLGEAVLILRTDDRGLETGVDRAEVKSRGLGRTLDATSGSATKLGRAMADAGNNTASAGDQTQKYSADLLKFKAQVDPAWASLMKFKDGAQLARQALAEGLITGKQYVEYMRASANAAGLLTSAQGKQVQMTGAQRAGMQQLGMQFNDMATMYMLGAKPAQIFASQIGQITQALQLMSGGTSRVAAFLGGPWGIALSTAMVVIVPFIAKLFESEDAANKSSKANETWAQKLDLSKHSLEEVTSALRDYNAEAKKANETTLDSAAAAAKSAAAAIREAIALREKIKATADIAEGMAKAAGDDATSNINAKYWRGRVAEQDKAIGQLRDAAQQATADVATELAKLDSDPTAAIKHRFDTLRKEAIAADHDVKTLTATLANLNRQEKAALEKVQTDKRATGASASSASNVGDMTALLQQLFPGARITSTTGGKHTKGSDHYAGRAIDFVPAGGMGQYSTAEVEKMLEAAGVTIRRNATGTKQLFGPGRSAKTAGDHDDHFHVAWTGSGSPEEAARKAEQAAAAAQRKKEQEARRQESFDRDLNGLMQEAANLRRQMGETLEEQYQLERQALDTAIAEQKRRITADADYTDAEKAKLLAQLEIKAGLERQLLAQRKREEEARQQLEVAQAFRANELDLLQMQSRLAGTREKRREIERRILDLTYDQERAALDAVVASSTATEAQKKIAQARLSMLGQLKAGDQEAMNREFASPAQRYMREVQGLDVSINDQLENAAVNGLRTLEDRLVDVTMRTRSLGAAFKDVAKEILSSLARIAIQRGIIGPLANLLFGPGEGSSGGGAGGSGGGGLVGSLLGGLFGGGNRGNGGGGGSSGLVDLNPGRTITDVMTGMFGKTGPFGFGARAGTGLLGSMFGGLFGGFKATGGLIPTGTFGIVGERGPEPIISTAAGTMVQPNSSLSQFGRGRDRPGKLEVNVNGARGNREIMDMVQAGVAEGLASYDEIVGDRVQDHAARRG